MKIIAFTIADKNNEKYAQMLVNSFKKFHPDIKIKVYGDDFIQKQLKFDNSFFYKATPLIASKLLKEYDLVIKLDADQIITGDLSALFAGDYDLGVVYNGNPTDVKVYGNISIQGVDVREYFNCGLVAMTNKKLVNHWLNLCNSKYFNRFQYREQDLMNVIAHFGEYSIKCFDDSGSWYGLRCIVTGKQIGRASCRERVLRLV